MLTDFRLQVFATVARRLSFTKAAAELHITQPAVTKHISELEKQLGCALFLRQGSRIALTEKGEELLRHALRILSLYRELNEAFPTDSASFCGTLRIGASTTISQYLLPPLLARFNRRYPLISITLLNGNSRQIEERLAAGELDFGLIEGDSVHPALRYELFAKDEIVLVTGTKNEAFRKEEVSLEELKQLPLLIREEGSGTLTVIDHALGKRGLSRRELTIRMQLGSSESIKRYLFRSDAFAFISVTAVADELANGKLRVIEVPQMEIHRTFRFVTRHGEHNRLAELFKQFCLSHYNRTL